MRLPSLLDELTQTPKRSLGSHHELEEYHQEFGPIVHQNRMAVKSLTSWAFAAGQG